MDLPRFNRQEVLYAYMVDNQAIVIPETIDAIRALTASERDAAASIRRTDEALGVGLRPRAGTPRWAPNRGDDT